MNEHPVDVVGVDTRVAVGVDTAVAVRVGVDTGAAAGVGVGTGSGLVQATTSNKPIPTAKAQYRIAVMSAIILHPPPGTNRPGTCYLPPASCIS